MIFILCILTSIIMITFVLLPLFLGSKEALSAHASDMGKKELEKVQKTLLEDYLKFEDLYKRNEIYKREWSQRQNFLLSRYVDITRRLDKIEGDL